MGLGQKNLIRVGSILFALLWFGFGKFPLNITNFFPLGQKNSLRVRSKNAQAQGQRLVSLLFTAGQ